MIEAFPREVIRVTLPVDLTNDVCFTAVTPESMSKVTCRALPQSRTLTCIIY